MNYWINYFVQTFAQNSCLVLLENRGYLTPSQSNGSRLSALTLALLVCKQSGMEPFHQGIEGS